MDNDHTESLQQQLAEALAKRVPLAIAGGHSKDFYGREVSGSDFSLTQHSGVVDYDPRELVVTARAGTRLKTLQQELADNGQMLPFEPPAFGSNATLGGTLACGFSGPRRPFVGSARDFVLGTQILNGEAQLLTFGGQVMKNVAGYDLSRLMIGALGTLGILLQASLKVLPLPETEQTLVTDTDADAALLTMNRLAGQNIPLSAAAWLDGRLYLRLSGMAAAVQQAASQLGGEPMEDNSFWSLLAEHELAFFPTAQTLWRFSVPPATPMIDLPGRWLIDWAGAQRWFVAEQEVAAERCYQLAKDADGHASQFRHGDSQSGVFQPLSDGLLDVHRRLKQTLDPHGIFNPGRLYPEI